MHPARSLKVQILGYFLAVVGLVSTLSLAVMYAGGSRVLEAWMIRSNRFLAKAVRRHLEQGLARGARSAEALSQRLAATRASPAEREKLIDHFLDFGALFSNAYLFEADGTLVLTRYREGRDEGHSRRGVNYRSYPGPFPAAADAVLASGKTTFTPVFYTTTGRPQIAHVLPVAGADGKPVEVLSLALYAVSDQINAWIKGLEPGRQGYIAVLDVNDRVLALTGPAPESLVEGRARSAGSLAPLGSRSVGIIVIDGREDLVIQEPLSTAGLRVLVGLPRSVAYAPMEDLTWPAVLAVVAAIALGLAGAILLASRLLRPIAQLVSGIRRVGEGVLSHRVTLDREDELGEAAAAFNRMAERLHRDQLIEEVWREVRRR
ncbi:MAG: HAMP domain-containing protein [Candidatus Riflebacteria bacterium]|nr:HAMP domain-containing protein [Candidatus Riflebacteria bacterium]